MPDGCHLSTFSFIFACSICHCKRYHTDEYVVANNYGTIYVLYALTKPIERYKALLLGPTSSLLQGFQIVIDRTLLMHCWTMLLPTLKQIRSISESSGAFKFIRTSIQSGHAVDLDISQTRWSSSSPCEDANTPEGRGPSQRPRVGTLQVASIEPSRIRDELQSYERSSLLGHKTFVRYCTAFKIRN